MFVKLIHPLLITLCLIFVFDSIFHFRFLLHLIPKENIWGFEAAADAMQFQDTSSSCINLQLWTFAKCYHLMRLATTQFTSIISSYKDDLGKNSHMIQFVLVIGVRNFFLFLEASTFKKDRGREKSEVSAHCGGWEQGEKLDGLSADPQTTHLTNQLTFQHLRTII